MIKNEKGSTLITVLLIFTVFTILGFVLIAASLNGAKRTEIREDAIIDDMEALRAIKEGTAIIESYITQNGAELITLPSAEYDARLELFRNAEETKQIEKEKAEPEAGTFRLANVTADYPAIDPDSDYTRVFEISSGDYTQKLYVSAMPSFMKYALGSGKTLTINGSPWIDGNIYAQEKLMISSEAQYVNQSEHWLEPTSLPAIEDYKEVNVPGGSMSYCISDCYEQVLKGPFSETKRNWMIRTGRNIGTAFGADGKVLYKAKQDSLAAIDVFGTFLEKLGQAGYGTVPRSLENMSLAEYIRRKAPAGIKEISNFTNLEKQQAGHLLYHVEDGSQADISGVNIAMDDNSWLIINGDATIEGYDSDCDAYPDTCEEQIDISANILINGNLEIKGRVGFDSVIYVMGETKINKALIGYPAGEKIPEQEQGTESELIVMTQGNLSINRVNAFENAATDIKGYFYTANELKENAEIYAVGSLLNIHGGIYAASDLTVNSYRGDASYPDKNNPVKKLTFLKNDAKNKSRLQITNNRQLFLGKSHALPKVDGLDLIPDKLEHK